MIQKKYYYLYKKNNTEIIIILKRKAKPKPNHRFQEKMVTLSLFDRKASKVEEFVTVYKLYLKMRMRELIVKE